MKLKERKIDTKKFSIRIPGVPEGAKVYQITSQNLISKENKTHWQNEKRIKELSRRGYNPDQIKGMMDSPRDKFSTRKIEKLKKHKVSISDMRIDGRL